MEINERVRQENLKNKAINRFQKEYAKALKNDTLRQPLSYALWQTWKYFDRLEQPKLTKRESENNE